MPDEERIRRRAHAIWEREGRPEGRREEHWAQARREIEAEEGGSAIQGGAPDDHSPTPTAPDHGGTTPAEAAAAATALGVPRQAEQASPKAGRASDAPPPPTAPDHGGTPPAEAAAAAIAVGAPRKADPAPKG